jgi:hypothetical protein
MSGRYEIAPISDEEIKAEERRVFFSERIADSDEDLLDAYSQTVIGVAERVSWGAARSDPWDRAAHAPGRPRGSSR